jgi:hypothetical protein
MKISKITTDQYDRVNVTYSLMWLGQLRKFWKFGVSRSSESVFGHVPQATMRLMLILTLLTLILRLHKALSMSYCTKSGIASYNGKNA